LIECVADYDVLITRFGFQVDREVIDAGRRLKIIASPVTGLDHIDTEYVRERGLRVVSLKGETAFLESIPATAEHTWALLLALVRHVPAAVEATRSGIWNRDAFRGHEVQNKTLGIVGLGRVGRKVAQYGLAFGMTVSAFDPYNTNYPEGVQSSKALHELLATSDVISLHVPLSRETEELIGSQEFAVMKGGSFLVNTSRGKVVDEGALLEALQSGRLAGAALDVVCDRDRVAEFARKSRNLIVTPHLGGATAESMQKTEVFIAGRLKEICEEIS
jgi:D-3-phosphoglycerate dehydrogenase